MVLWSKWWGNKKEGFIALLDAQLKQTVSNLDPKIYEMDMQDAMLEAANAFIKKIEKNIDIVKDKMRS